MYLSYLLCTFLTIRIIVPGPIVNLSAMDDNPIVGKAFPMECNVTVARGIISSVDIIWTVNGTVKARANNTMRNMSSQHVLHKYEITELQLSDDNAMYYCSAVINAYTNMEGSDSITISNLTLSK